MGLTQEPRPRQQLGMDATAFAMSEYATRCGGRPQGGSHSVPKGFAQGYFLSYYAERSVFKNQLLEEVGRDVLVALNYPDDLDSLSLDAIENHV